MTGQPWNRKLLTVIVASLVCVVVAASIALAYPTEVSNSQLGADWQCHKSAGILVTCTRVSHVAPMVNHPRSHLRSTELRSV